MEHHCHKDASADSHCKKGHDEQHHQEHHKEGVEHEHHCHEDSSAKTHCKKGHDHEHHHEHHEQHAHHCHKDGEAESHCKKGHDDQHHHEHHKDHHEHNCHQAESADSQCKKGHDDQHHHEHHKDHHEHHCHQDKSADSHCKKGHDDKHHHEHHRGGDCDHKMKLYYFNTRGRAELIRFILSFAKEPFEDIRFTKEEWPAVKKNYPAGQVPVLDLHHCDKIVRLSQSLTIARHLAKRFDLTGKSCIEAAQCDEVVDCLNDLINLAVLAFLEQDATRREMIRNRLKDDEYPRILGYLEEKLVANGGKHIVGEKWTYADLAISVFLGGLQLRGADMDRIAAQFPALFKLGKDVENIPEIAAWVAQRPAEKADV